MADMCGYVRDRNRFILKDVVQKIKPISFPYTLTIPGLLSYYTMLAVLLALMFSRKSAFWYNLPPALHTWGSHVSNLSISCMLYLTIGLIWTLQGVPPKVLAWLGVVLIAANFIVELFIPIVNTRDVVDALFGAAGVLLGGLCLYCLRNMKRELKH